MLKITDKLCNMQNSYYFGCMTMTDGIFRIPYHRIKI